MLIKNKVLYVLPVRAFVGRAVWLNLIMWENTTISVFHWPIFYYYTYRTSRMSVSIIYREAKISHLSTSHTFVYCGLTNSKPPVLIPALSNEWTTRRILHREKDAGSIILQILLFYYRHCIRERYERFLQQIYWNSLNISVLTAVLRQKLFGFGRNSTMYNLFIY